MARVQDNDTKRKHSESSNGGKDGGKNVVNSSFSLGGLLGGLGGLIEKLGELAEAGEELSRSGELKDAAGKIRGVYGINIKTGLGDQGQTELKVEPFGNVHRNVEDRPAGDDVREPLVDIHEEDDYVLVLMELPGVAKENVELKAADGQLELSAKRGTTSYRKQIDLPDDCSAEQMVWPAQAARNSD